MLKTLVLVISIFSGGCAYENPLFEEVPEKNESLQSVPPSRAPELIQYSWITCVGGVQVTCNLGIEHGLEYLPSKSIIASDIDWGDGTNSVSNSNIQHHNYEYAGSYLLVAKIRYLYHGIEFQASTVTTIRVNL